MKNRLKIISIYQKEPEFNDLDALEADLADVESNVSSSVESFTETISENNLDDDSSRSILLKIEEELLSIKGDLTDLKNELFIIKIR